jgi:hypothetical protein
MMTDCFLHLLRAQAMPLKRGQRFARLWQGECAPLADNSGTQS